MTNSQANVSSGSAGARPQSPMRRQYFLRMPLREQILFAKRLGLLTRSGVPIVKALRMIQSQAGTRSSRYVLGRVTADVESGQALSVGMDKFKQVFGHFAVNLVRVGEVGGNLNTNLNYLAEELRKQQELRRKVVSALVYPIFIVIATLGIAVLLTAYVFPKIMPIFQSFNFRLPITTRILIAVSSFMSDYWYYLLGGLVVVVISGLLLRQVRSVKLRFDRLILRLPLLGSLFESYQLANFTRTLGLLLKSDVRIIEALHIVAGTMTNLAYHDELQSMAENLTGGTKISDYMELRPKLFPPILRQMIAVGETTGNLSETLLYLSEMYEDELNNQTKNLSTSIEPVLMIFMGFLVGFIAISIITPIYGITQNLHP